MLEMIGWVLLVLPVAIALYVFVIYPAIVYVWSRFRSADDFSADPAEWPELTILIVAYNEERRIGETLRKALAVDYPHDKLSVLVVSDASTDRTDDIVRGIGDPRVTLHRVGTRQGKAHGENESAQFIRGEIVVSIDASIIIPPPSLKALVRAFSDPAVGLASGRDLSVGDEAREGTTAESSYVDLEMRLRAAETRVHSIVGASGCFYGTRRQLHETRLPDVISRDFAAASVARAAGFRAVSVDAATCLVPRTKTLRVEQRRKTRTMARGLDTLFYFKQMMNPLRYGSFAFMMISHKLMRWLLFPSLLGWLIAPVLLWSTAPWSMIFAIGMLVGIGLARLTAVLPDDRRLPNILAFPAYIFVSIVAAWGAWLESVSGRKTATWEPTPR
jgi:cellulose synthase/poly-beta-1,6-N-acetylglucosamine synthase-like glycosyltransferase